MVSYILNCKVNLRSINSICSIIISTMAEKQQNAFMYEKSLSLIKDICKNKEGGSKVIFFGKLIYCQISVTTRFN